MPPAKEYVRALFDAIARRYDLLNHLLSGGIDIAWRRRAIEHLHDHRPGAVLDVATGTGDFALAALRLNPREVIGVDISEGMLRHGREKVLRRGRADVVTLAQGDAEALPFPDARFDAVTVAFGVRNFEHLQAGLMEMHRVLRPGGKAVILEFSRPRAPVFRHLYHAYFRAILPLFGRAVSGHREAYRYLPDTVMGFPEGDEFLEILGRAGFVSLAQERLTGGIASIYTGIRKPAEVPS